MDRAERAARLERWLRVYSEKGTFDISVADPKPKRGGGITSAVLGPTTLFTVTTRSPDDERKDLWSVERSMADFTALRTSLVHRFPGAVLGHLPESRLLSDLTKSKEEKKTKQGEILTHFIRILARHPFISQDQVFLTFLSVGSKFTDALKAVVPNQTPGRPRLTRMMSSTAWNKRKSLERDVAVALSEEPVSATDWWREAIDLAAEPEDPLRLCKDVLNELDLIRKRVTDLKVTIRECKDKLKDLGTNCLDMSKAFRNWLAVEFTPETVAVAAEASPNGQAAVASSPGALSDDSKGEEVQLVSMSMPVLLAENANRFQNQGLIHQRMALDATATLLSAVREEILVLEAMKEEVTAARDAVIRVEEAKALLQKREKELHVAEEQARQDRMATAYQYGNPDMDDSEDPNFEKRTRNARKAVEDAQANLETAIAVASTLTRSTLNLELNFFREERIIRSDKFFAEFAMVHSEYCKRSLDVWTMDAIHGLPNPPVASSALTGGLSVKPRVPIARTAHSAMLKSGVYDVSATDDESDGFDDSENPVEAQTLDGADEQLIEWSEDIPWDKTRSRPVKIIHDFEPEFEDELDAKTGEYGTGVPFDDDGQWLHVKLDDGRSGIIPVNFIRIVVPIVQKAKSDNKKKSKESSFSEMSVTSNGTAADARIAELEAELTKLRAQNEMYKRELSEREGFMEQRTNELRQANQTIEKMKETSASLRNELLKVTEERDHALQQLAKATSAMSSTPRSTPSHSVSKAASASPASASPKVEVDPNPEEDLPPNWVKVLDKTRNRYFYHNTETKESVWKRPGSTQQGQKRKQGEL